MHTNRDELVDGSSESPSRQLSGGPNLPVRIGGSTNPSPEQDLRASNTLSAHEEELDEYMRLNTPACQEELQGPSDTGAPNEPTISRIDNNADRLDPVERDCAPTASAPHPPREGTTEEVRGRVAQAEGGAPTITSHPSTTTTPRAAAAPPGNSARNSNTSIRSYFGARSEHRAPTQRDQRDDG